MLKAVILICALGTNCESPVQSIQVDGGFESALACKVALQKQAHQAQVAAGKTTTYFKIDCSPK